ncbi:SecY-interacting protein [Aestuariibacter sp. A3R04]|uniref:SecY-interacting protein n=1 Tax=Aestuariibacter sp. A3R04 TaxID=2841571 RepID=UPI001C09E1D7|nr:SecY-interacting protein [Aestuariibacter sp. A3R04]MBU3022107.1 SecY-interacting protein [Aestuariibacter sp. A3R04]
MTLPVEQSLDVFFNKFLKLAQEKTKLLEIDYDEDWPSPCYQSQAKNGETVKWRPVRQSPRGTFDDLSAALSINIHPDFSAYFSAYYSFHLPAIANQGECELLQVCSEQDFRRLQENLIGHVLMKQRLKQSPTLFFALTQDDDYIISLDNGTGEVVLERVGKTPERVLAPNMATFITDLNPM